MRKVIIFSLITLLPLVAAGALAAEKSNRNESSNNVAGTEYAEERCDIDLPADSLANTLVKLGLQCNIPVVVPFEWVEGYRSSPVIGKLSIAEAGRQALKHVPFKLLVQEQPVRQIVLQPKVETPNKTPKSHKTESLDSSIEEIVVTGIRASLDQSVQIKRSAIGVVDAITAQDIGQFPDTNLAESIQRIPGAAISRRDGEGSEITVRGFTANYNLVTFNGRVLPVISAPTDQIEDSRTFEFSNLAADNISRVEVQKTHSAELFSGGIGATVDVQSYRPLENSAAKNYVSIKLVDDQSAPHSDTPTAEMSGMLTWDYNKTYGLSVAASYQERRGGVASAAVDQWATQAWVEPGLPGAVSTHTASCEAIGGDPNTDRCVTLENPPVVGALYSMPSSLNYAVSETSRKRWNSITTFQYAPSTNWLVTLDHAYFKTERETEAAEMLFRLTDYRSYLAFDDGRVKTPSSIGETYFDAQGQPSASSVGFASQLRNRVDTTQLFGLNVGYENGSAWRWELDAHRSVSTSGPGDNDYGSWAQIRFGANVLGAMKVDGTTELPAVRFTVNDNLLQPHNTDDGVFTAADIGTQVAFNKYSYQRNEMEQWRFSGDYQGDLLDVKFGLEYADSYNSIQFSEKTVILGDWGIRDPSFVPDDLFTPMDFTHYFDRLKAPEMTPQGYSANAGELLSWSKNYYAEAFQDGFQYDPNFAVDRSVREETLASYIKAIWQGENIALEGGLRFSQTDLLAIAQVNQPLQMIWLDNGDFSPEYDLSKQPESQKNQYHHILPSFNLRYEPWNNRVLRFSYSQSLARADYAELSPEISNIQVTGITEAGRINAFATSGNPTLEPLKSDNLDLSFEWYWGSVNYASIGYFNKRIDNFIGAATTTQPVYGLRDASAGPRANAARQTIASQPDYDGVITDTELFNQIAATENNDFNPDSNDENYYGDEYDIFPLAEDPPFEFATLRPVNNRQANVWGWEYALQHFFNGSGLGLIVNYTDVDGDIGYDIYAPPNTTQFALLGLSDTANVIGVWEKHHWHMRLAYNWRDEYLESIEEEPVFVESYYQLDFMLRYDLSQQLSISLEGINITAEDARRHGRTAAQLVSYQQLDSRYLLGLSYQF